MAQENSHGGLAFWKRIYIRKLEYFSKNMPLNLKLHVKTKSKSKSTTRGGVAKKKTQLVLKFILF